MTGNKNGEPRPRKQGTQKTKKSRLREMKNQMEQGNEKNNGAGDMLGPSTTEVKQTRFK